MLCRAALGHCLGATDNIHEFQSNGRLSFSIHFLGEIIYQIAGVLGGIVHGLHSNRLLARIGFQQRTPDLKVDMTRYQSFEQTVGGRLKNVIRASLFSLLFLGLDIVFGEIVFDWTGPVQPIVPLAALYGLFAYEDAYVRAGQSVPLS